MTNKAGLSRNIRNIHAPMVNVLANSDGSRDPVGSIAHLIRLEVFYA